jgi:hypothetical protein
MAFTIASTYIDFRATSACQLNADMARSAEAIQTKPRPFPFVMSESGQTQAPVTDDAGAQEWCCLQIVEAVWQRIGERCGRSCVFCIAAIYGPSSEHRFVAQIFSTGNTELTDATGSIQPGHSNAISNIKTLDTTTASRHASNYLVTGNDT